MIRPRRRARWRSWAALLMVAMIVFVSLTVVWATAREERWCWSPGTDCRDLTTTYSGGQVGCNQHVNFWDPVAPGSNSHTVYVGDTNRKSYGTPQYGYGTTVYFERASSDQSGAMPGYTWYDHEIDSWANCSDGTSTPPWKWWALRVHQHATNAAPSLNLPPALAARRFS